MKYGIYYAYWEKEWGGQFVPYVEKCRRLGFDILEVACGAFHLEEDSFFRELRQAASDNGILLTGGYGPRPEHNLASADEAAVERAFAFYADMFRKMELAGIDRIGGALSSFWPVDFSKPMDKPGDRERSVRRMGRLADMAADRGITLCMEALNRFEGYMINDAAECVSYVRQGDRPNVKVMLDTFHMNIEEDDMAGAIRTAGDLLCHFHTGECNRKVPGQGRMPWKEIGEALREVGFDGYAVMEPFVRRGGQIERDIHIWRELRAGITGEMLDQVYAISLLTGERVSNVVVMGTGEPLDNYDSLVRFLELLTDEKGLHISARNITVSTCGLVPQMRKLAREKLQITLALSLHAATDEKRRSLMPVANRYGIGELMEACREYFERTGRRITFEYSLVGGVNDTREDARLLAALAGPLRCHVNLIPVNPIKEREYVQSEAGRIQAFKNMLEKNGINVTIRREMGRDIDGACGQLRRSYMQEDQTC